MGLTNVPALPFPMGSTWSGNSTGPGATSVDGAMWEGSEFEIPNYDYSTSPARPMAYYANGQRESITIRCVRNVSTVVFAKKRFARYKDGYPGLRCDGYAYAIGDKGGIVDPYLPYDVAIGDLFWLVIRGKVTAKTVIHTADVSIGIGVNERLAVFVVATSTGTTAGRVHPILYTGATTQVPIIVEGKLGKALTAVTTNGTDQDILVAVGAEW